MPRSCSSLFPALRTASIIYMLVTSLPGAMFYVVAKADKPISEAKYVSEPTPLLTDQLGTKPNHKDISNISLSLDLINLLSETAWKDDYPFVIKASGQTFRRPDGLNVLEAAGEPVYMLAEFGCNSVITKCFRQGRYTCTVNVFQFETPQGAFGAYTVMRKGASTVVLIGDACSEDEKTISFWKDKYFISLATDSQEYEEHKELIRKFAYQLAAGIPNHSEIPPLVHQLPALDRLGGSEKYIMGPLTAKRLFPAPFITTLFLKNPKGSITATYQLPHPENERLKLLLLDYGNPAWAQAAYTDYVENLKLSHKEQEQGKGSCLFKLSDFYLLCKLNGNEVAIISGARKRLALLMLARQLSATPNL